MKKHPWFEIQWISGNFLTSSKARHYPQCKNLILHELLGLHTFVMAIVLRAQSFTSLKIDLHQDTNAVYAFSRCALMEHFLKGSASLRLCNVNEKITDQLPAFITLPINRVISFSMEICSLYQTSKWLRPKLKNPLTEFTFTFRIQCIIQIWIQQYFRCRCTFSCTPPSNSKIHVRQHQLFI